MTDRIKGCWVSFERDIREDDAGPLLQAIQQLRGVSAVTADPADPADWMARDRVRRELSEKLWAVLHPTDQGSLLRDPPGPGRP
jgi:hypothetical protein